jgi:hypothetical protein
MAQTGFASAGTAKGQANSSITSACNQNVSSAQFTSHTAVSRYYLTEDLANSKHKEVRRCTHLICSRYRSKRNRYFGNRADIQRYNSQQQ